MRKISIILFFTMLTLVVKAQIVPQFTQYVFNQFYINPAAAGINNKANVQLSARSQYTGYTNDLYPGGNNNISVLTAEIPLQKVKGALGLVFSNNQFSKIQTKQEVLLSYAFHKRVRSNVYGAGVGVGINSLSLKTSNYVPRDAGDPLLGEIDPLLISSNLNMGGYILNPVYQVGFSIKNPLNAKYKTTGGSNITENRTVYLTGKYDFGISYTLDVSPMLMVKSDLVQTSTEIGMMVTSNQKYWAALNYRWEDAIGIMAGANIRDFSLGYAFDYVVVGSVIKSANSHELFLRYNFKNFKIGKKSIVRTPRYSF